MRFASAIRRLAASRWNRRNVTSAARRPHAATAAGTSCCAIATSASPNKAKPRMNDADETSRATVSNPLAASSNRPWAKAWAAPSSAAEEVGGSSCKVPAPGTANIRTTAGTTKARHPITGDHRRRLICVHPQIMHPSPFGRAQIKHTHVAVYGTACDESNPTGTFLQCARAMHCTWAGYRRLGRTLALWVAPAIRGSGWHKGEVALGRCFQNGPHAIIHHLGRQGNRHVLELHTQFGGLGRRQCPAHMGR